MGLRDKKRNQRRVLSRRSAGPNTGEGKDFLVRASFRTKLKPANRQHIFLVLVVVADVVL